MANRLLTVSDVLGPIPDGYKEVPFDELPVGAQFYFSREPLREWLMKKTHAQRTCTCPMCGDSHTPMNSVFVEHNTACYFQEGARVMVKA